MPVTLQDIRAARDRIGDAIYRSPCPYSLMLSRLCGAEIYCKLDHLQITGSFKERGARNKLLMLNQVSRKRGVVAASAGNHALGLSYHGQLLGVPVTVFMPRGAPIVKVANCKSFGATVFQHGDSYDDARGEAVDHARKSGQTYVPGFDDDDIIAGAGTLGLEILEDVSDVDAIIVPVGGGGLISGIGIAVKALRPEVRVIGVESAAAPTVHESLRLGKITRIVTRPTLADGLAVAEMGARCFDIIRQVVDDIVLVEEPQIASAVLRLLELEKMVIEGAASVSLAAAMGRTLNLDGKKIVLLLCGGNIDVTVISRIIERGLAADGRLCRLRITISDRPGALAILARMLGDAGASIKEIEHDRHFGPADVASVAVNLVLETRDFDHVRDVRKALAEAGFDVT